MNHLSSGVGKIGGLEGHKMTWIPLVAGFRVHIVSCGWISGCGWILGAPRVLWLDFRDTSHPQPHPRHLAFMVETGGLGIG